MITITSQQWSQWALSAQEVILDVQLEALTTGDIVRVALPDNDEPWFVQARLNELRNALLDMKLVNYCQIVQIHRSIYQFNMWHESAPLPLGLEE